MLDVLSKRESLLAFATYRPFRFLGILVVAVGFASAAAADEARVMISGGLSAAYGELGPKFEKQTGVRLVTAYGPSMGTTINAIPVRLARGEKADVIIAARNALDNLARRGLVDPQSEVDLVRSPIGLAVKKGHSIPNIATAADLKRTLLKARSIAYSDSASGVYVSTELFARLGIASRVKSKVKEIQATPVGEIVAAGKAEIGFQQMSELLPVPGIEVVGPIPQSVQHITVFSAGITTNAAHPQAAHKLIEMLISREARPSFKRDGLEPAH
jgi:molybdate transport system substrate-binding protein